MLPVIAPAPVPRLSVIVPIHNTEAYLAACLDSLAAQRLLALEVLMVDDGSTDGSAEIAAAYAARDARFRLVRQANGGLGSARNTGVRHIAPTSDYLAFLDSDDLLPPDAYQTMVDALDDSGSDFATGNVHHLAEHPTDGVRTWQPSMFRMLAARSRRRTHISRFPALVADRTACNKVYRRAFWERHRFAFPEGVLYEDIPVTLPAHYLAEAVDVLSAPVYYWRVREAGAAPSITHRRTEPGACRDRVQAVESVSRFLAAQRGARWAAYKRHYDRSALQMDLRTFLTLLPEGDERYHQEFLLHTRRFLHQVDPAVLRELPVEQRVQWELVRRRALPELLASLTADRDRQPVRVRGRWRRHARFPEQPPTALPRRARRLTRQDLRLHTPARELRWERGKLRISGDAWISRVDAPTRFSHAKAVQLRLRGSQRRLVLPVRNRYRPERTASSGGRAHCYDWAGYEVVIDPARLRSHGGWEEGTWLVGIGLVAPGLVRTGPIVPPGGGHPVGYPPYHWVSEDHRVVPSMAGGRLTLRVERVRALITGRARYGNLLEVRGELRQPPRPDERLSLRLTARDDGEVRDYPVETTASGAGFAVRVPLSDLLPPALRHALATAPPEDLVAGETPEDTGSGGDTPPQDVPPEGTSKDALAGVPRAEDTTAHPAPRPPAGAPEQRGWHTALVLTGPDGTEHPLDTVVRDGLPDAEFRLPRALRPPDTGPDTAARPAPDDRCAELATVAGHDGRLGLWVRPAQAVIVDTAWTDDGELRLAGRTTARTDGHGSLVLRRHGAERTVPLERLRDGVFEVTLTPAALPTLAGELPLPAGDWDLALRLPTRATDLPCRIDRLAVPRAAHPVTCHGRRYELRVRHGDRPHLLAHSELPPEERGNYRQHQLLTHVYRPLRERPLRDAVLYVSYQGKQCSDSPRAIFDELLRRDAPLEHLWLVRDGQAVTPPGARTVRLWSREWYEALATCRYVVTNGHLPEWLERRPGQVVVQTWHGTMLKRIGLDIARPQFDTRYHDRVRRDAANWSLLVSPSRFATPLLRRAFGYDGEIVEAGHPRNDRLLAPDRHERARRVRQRLDLPDDRRVVLYAPTWRDDLAAGRGEFHLDLHLDPDQFRRRLGEDHILLVRSHSHVSETVPGADGEVVRDVSAYPEVADLYLVADVLVTDYSSAMFDYALTGRPLLFYTYDLEHYRDTLRGFTLDFEREAPGPLLRTTEEVCAALADLDRVAAAHHDAHARFVRRYCDLDDGHAAARVTDRMLHPRTATARPHPTRHTSSGTTEPTLPEAP